MATYYATVKVEGTASSQDFKVTAQSGSEAKKIIEMRVGGKVKFMDPLTDPGAQGAALIPGLTAARGQRGRGDPSRRNRSGAAALARPPPVRGSRHDGRPDAVHQVVKGHFLCQTNSKKLSWTRLFQRKNFIKKWLGRVI